mmetsp:Transcript_2146/g.6353  ORF Transcript_2146/g.6353 Transcript_2146/m.6353 type:complete len:241 (+) Transcript_2146:17-739(+)
MNKHEYEQRWLEASDELEKLQVSYQQLQNTNEALRLQIELLNKQQMTYLAAKHEAETRAYEAKLKMDVMRQNALIDRRAREGQFKRMRVIEHQMKDITAESRKERQQLAKAEEQASDLKKALNRERAQRLHDLHQSFRVIGESLSATQRERAIERRCVSTQKDVEFIGHSCALLENALLAQERINEDSTCTLAQQESAIERGHTERIMLKSALKEMRDHDGHTHRQLVSLRLGLPPLQTG